MRPGGLVRIGVALGAASLALFLGGCAGSDVDVSGDGRTVAVNRSGTLWVADVERETWRKVPTAAGECSGAPSWSPDGQVVAFARQPAPQEARPGEEVEPQQVRAVLFDTRTEVTTELAEGVGQPFAWSGDGEELVAVRRRAHADDPQRLVWLGRDGTLRREVVLPVAKLWISQVTWLPGTQEVAFSAVLFEGRKWWRPSLYRTDGDDVRRIAAAQDLAGIGADAEHGRLLWARNAGVGRRQRLEVYALDTASKEIRRLSAIRGPWARPAPPGFRSGIASVSFSGNGERMAVITTVSPSRPREGVSNRVACRSVELDGSGNCPIREVETSSGTLRPAWSRDGRRLVVLDDTQGEPRLFVYNYDGTGKRMAALPESASR